MNEEKNKKILSKDVDLIVAYLLIFSFGLALVFIMVNYLDKEVTSFKDQYEQVDVD